GLLKFVPYGDTALTANGAAYTPNLTPVYSLGDDDYIVKSPGDPPLLTEIEDQSDAYNVVQLEYLDRSNQYNMAIALASDAANVQQYGARRKEPDTAHVICTPAVAALAAQLWLQRTLYIRAQYKFKLGWQFALLEPGDLLELTDAGLGLAAYTVRIIQIDEDEKDGTLDVTCEDFPLGVHNAPLYAMQESAPTLVNRAVDPGGVEANLLLWTGDFTQGVWGKSAITVTAAAAADPVTGASDATKLTPSTANGLHQVAQSTDGNTTFADANYTAAVYAKADGYSQVELILADPDGNAIFVSVDLNAGTILGQGTAQVTGGAIGTEAGGDILTEGGATLETDP
ncbi:MAG TPA: phage tail protein, partial [Caulobacteraceae bacterium]|nr:phage tail protein [Caulobacteraceae bacterium]